MADFLLYEAKTALLIAAAYILFKLALSRETLFGLNRVVLLCSAVLAFILPLCVITVHRTVELPMAAAPYNAEVTAASLDAAGMGKVQDALAPTEPWWVVALAAVYAAGVVVMLARMAAGISGLFRMIRGGKRKRVFKGSPVIVTEKRISAFSWMRWIVMSREDYEEGSIHVFEHEKAHIRLGHSADVLFMEFMTLLQWFNPFVWMLRSELRAVHEYEADARVICSGTPQREYQYSLIQKAIGASGYSITNGFNHSILKNRIAMMTKSRSSASRGLRVLYAIPLVAVTLAANARTVTYYLYAPAAEVQEPQEKGVVLEIREAGIYSEGKAISAEEARELVAASSEATVTIKADGSVKCGIVTDLKDSLRQVSGIRIKYELIGNGPSAAPRLEPTPSD